MTGRRPSEGGFQPLKAVDIHEPFNVLCGAVLVRGNMQMTITQGGTWPGTRLASEELWEAVDPVDLSMLPGTRISKHVTPRDLEAGHALMLSIAMSRPDVNLRMLVARETYPDVEERCLRELCNIDRSTWRRMQAKQISVPAAREHNNAPLFENAAAS